VEIVSVISEWIEKCADVAILDMALNVLSNTVDVCRNAKGLYKLSDQYIKFVSCFGSIPWGMWVLSALGYKCVGECMELHLKEVDMRVMNCVSSYLSVLMREQQHQQEGSEEEVCSICLESISMRHQQIGRTSCNHVFHHRCLSSWLAHKKQCPVCRTKQQF
jgi:hypothetical protein